MIRVDSQGGRDLAVPRCRTLYCSSFLFFCHLKPTFILNSNFHVSCKAHPWTLVKIKPDHTMDKAGDFQDNTLSDYRSF